MGITDNIFVEMDFDEWFDKYKPIKNHLDEHSSFDGYMFETYDEEVEFVKAQDENRIWMYGDGDDGGGYIWNGWHFINRIGYFITEVPCPDNTTIQVLVSVPCFYCENCDAEHDDPDNLIRDKYQELFDEDRCPNCVTKEELEAVNETV